MGFLPELDENGALPVDNRKGERKSVNWANLNIMRCPLCGNLLKGRGRGSALYLMCKSAKHLRPFWIRWERAAQLRG